MTLDTFIQETTELADGIEGLPQRLQHGRFLFGFRIVDKFQPPTLHGLLKTMREAERGWDNGPVFATEFCDHRPIENTDRNAVECQISGSRIHGYWRAVPDGMGVFQRDYLEDNDARGEGLPPGRIIGLTFPIRDVGQCLRYVKRLGELLVGRAASVECRFEWTGIQNRKYDSSYATSDTLLEYGHLPVTKSRAASEVTVSTADLETGLASAVLRAVTPIYKALSFDVTEDFVKRYL